MKIVLQRTTGASVTVDNRTVGKIDHGLVILLGISDEDTKETVKLAIYEFFMMKTTK